MHRDRAPRVLVTCAVAVASLSLPGCDRLPWASDEPPNFVVIVTDDQPPGSMSVLPKTSAWFRDGTRFTQAYVTTPLCCPSRASIFSGRFAHNHGVMSNYRRAQAEAYDQTRTVQAALQGEGYDAGIFGKYLNSWDLAVDPPHFAEWAIFAKSQRAYESGQWNVDGEVQTVSEYATDYIAERATQFIRRRRDSERPWVLFLFPPAPHDPFVPAERDAESTVPPAESTPAKAEEDVSDKPPYVKQMQASDERIAEIRTGQLRSLQAVDDLVTAVRRALEDTEQTADTMALFSSDNGYLWGEHGLIKKGFPYTRSIQVPMMIKWPESVEGRGGTDDRFVTNVDIAPTILDVADVRSHRPMDGRSLARAGPGRDAVFMEYFREGYFSIPSWDSVRTRDAQYVQYYGRDGRVIFREYYDLVEDPWQTENLLGDRDRSNDPEAGEFESMIDRFKSCTGDSCP